MSQPSVEHDLTGEIKATVATAHDILTALDKANSDVHANERLYSESVKERIMRSHNVSPSHCLNRAPTLSNYLCRSTVSFSARSGPLLQSSGRVRLKVRPESRTFYCNANFLTTGV